MSVWTKEAIKALRLRSGLSQEDFAHRIGTSFSTVNRWENGHSKPSRLAQRWLDRVERDVADGGEVPPAPAA